MVGYIILGLILLLLLIPLGADVNYEGGELTVSVKVWKFLIQILPKAPPDPNAPPKEKKPKKPKKIKKKKPKDEKEGEQPPKPKKKKKLDFTFDELLSLLKKVFRGVGKLFRIRVERFMLHFTAGGTDPYSTAQTFGYVNAALSALAPICAKKYKHCDTDVRTDIDFTLDSMKIDGGIAFTMRLWNVFAALNTILFGALGILIRNKVRLAREKRRAKKENKGSEDTPAQETPAEEIRNNEENIQVEERIEQNGN